MFPQTAPALECAERNKILLGRMQILDGQRTADLVHERHLLDVVVYQRSQIDRAFCRTDLCQAGKKIINLFH